ncbi:putative nucleotide-binding alpha-beta plait domain-containing protein [Rosa chinensis]|uniref:Putative nucleotide-binding alpha-beta plait domain-containing protein n=1 Tax=Rosa chinensis TaxID=74649 RepID=A0A2P6PP87_ROSCH|nr:putative nucleotide-binding alpha-beta plait domain-containing protein [Rosa chinensis]
MASAEIEFRCFVGGLAWATDNEALERAFAPFGEIIESKIINDRETGRSRGFGFVTFSNEKAMRDAIEGMNGQDLDGRNITVNEAQSRGSGGGGGGGGYGGSRGGGGYGSGGGGYGGRREGGGGGYGSGGGAMEAVVEVATEVAAGTVDLMAAAGGVRSVRVWLVGSGSRWLWW